MPKKKKPPPPAPPSERRKMKPFIILKAISIVFLYGCTLTFIYIFMTAYFSHNFVTEVLINRAGEAHIEFFMIITMGLITLICLPQTILELRYYYWRDRIE